MQYYIKYSHEVKKKKNLNFTNLSQINYINIYNLETYNL